MSIKKGYISPHPPIIWCSDINEEQEKMKATKDSLERIAKEINDDESIETVILITPHGPIFADGIVIYSEEILSGNLLEFSGKMDTDITVKSDLEFIDSLVDAANFNDIVTVKMDKTFRKRFNLKEDLDHGSVVPMLFIKEKLKSCKVVIINYGLLSEEKLYKFGMIVEQVSNELNRESVIIASGDMSHKASIDSPYGYDEKGEEFDKTFVENFEKGNIEDLICMDNNLVKEAAECGKKSFDIFFGVFDKYDLKYEKFSYEAPFGIGYFVGKVSTDGESPYNKYAEILKMKEKIRNQRLSKEDEYVKLARMTLKEFLSTGKIIDIPEDMGDEFFKRKGGVFVSLKDSGGLRGCIGTTGGIESNLGREIIRNAIKAGTEDPRFDPLSLEELIDLEITVDVLSVPKPTDDIKELDPKKFGVIVYNEYKQGVLLPDLKGIETGYEQIKIALNKAGIEENEDYSIKLFTVTRHY